MERIKTLKEFYPYYLSEHENRTCRRLHFVGTTCVLTGLVSAIILHEPKFLIPLPVLGYGPAWIGHFFFEKNRPATFKYPLFSLVSDFIMYRDILIGKIPF